MSRPPVNRSWDAQAQAAFEALGRMLAAQSKDALRREWRRRYEAGESTLEIARAFGTSAPSVCRGIRAAGGDVRRRAGRPPRCRAKKEKLSWRNRYGAIGPDAEDEREAIEALGIRKDRL